MGDFSVILAGPHGEVPATCGAVVLVGAETDRRIPGVYAVHPDASAPTLEAVAAKVGAILGRSVIRRDGSGAQVREALCRACGTCEEVCPFGAAEVRESRPVPGVRPVRRAVSVWRDDAGRVFGQGRGAVAGTPVSGVEVR